MAFKAKDGSLHTNKDTMKQADMKHMAHEPKEHEAHEPEMGEEGEQHDIGNLDELSNAFEQHLQEEAAGQPHDPENIKKLHQHFSKYLTEEKQEPEGY